MSGFFSTDWRFTFVDILQHRLREPRPAQVNKAFPYKGESFVLYPSIHRIKFVNRKLLSSYNRNEWKMNVDLVDTFR